MRRGSRSVLKTPRADYEQRLSRQMVEYWIKVSTREGRMRHVLVGVKARAKRQGIDFSITLADILPLPDTCPILGIPIAYNGPKKRRGYLDDSPSVDRVNPKLGYIRGNVWIISARANVIKNDGTAEDHERIAAWMRWWGQSR